MCVSFVLCRLQNASEKNTVDSIMVLVTELVSDHKKNTFAIFSDSLTQECTFIAFAFDALSSAAHANHYGGAL